MSQGDAAQESKLYLPSEATVAAAAVSGMAAYEALCKQADEDYEGFWAGHARRLLSWKQPFTKVLNEENSPFFKWFEDGTLNASYNCLDRNVERGLGDKTAIIFEADGGEVTRVSYSELLAKTCQMANGLKSLGIGKGDRVIIYIAMSIDGVGRHAGLRPHRRDPLGGVRRLLGPVPARPHRGHRRQGRHHR
jgi:acetyl-CoA synthetase